MTTPTALIVAKAPIAGLAKTRLAVQVGVRTAAGIAAAALLDTIDAAAATGWPVVIAMTGDLADAESADMIRAAIASHQVIGQRGTGFAERLANAHADAASRDGVVQVGMDTPQIDVADFERAAEALSAHDAALGMATDGGWWMLALRHARHARALVDVPMSTSTTGINTRTALEHVGATVGTLGDRTDVDEWADAVAVADRVPHTRFAQMVAAAMDQVSVR